MQGPKGDLYRVPGLQGPSGMPGLKGNAGMPGLLLFIKTSSFANSYHSTPLFVGMPGMKGDSGLMGGPGPSGLPGFPGPKVCVCCNWDDVCKKPLL
jgi:hypothetical protein